jgi:hypothetical protein
MENGLFWLSAVLAMGVFALTWVLRVLHAHPNEPSSPVSSLPEK